MPWACVDCSAFDGTRRLATGEFAGSVASKAAVQRREQALTRSERAGAEEEFDDVAFVRLERVERNRGHVAEVQAIDVDRGHARARGKIRRAPEARLQDRLIRFSTSASRGPEHHVHLMDATVPWRGSWVTMIPTPTAARQELGRDGTMPIRL